MTSIDAGDVAKLRRIVMSSPIIGPIMRRWSSVALPDCWLVAGVIAQTVWNDAFGFAPEHGVADIDLVYFDTGDLSEATERAHETRVRQAFAGVPAKFDLKNEARVHLWYETKFGVAIAPYTSAANAIGTFPTTATSIGIRPDGAGVAVVAPFGLADLLGLTVRPNKTQVTREVYEAKTRRWRAAWPGLTIIDW